MCAIGPPRYRTGAAASGNPARLYRFSYNPTTKTYSLDAGFPVQISNYSAEALTIDKDSAGVLWATWTQGSKVYVNSTTGGDAVWGTPFVLPTTGATGLNVDDISAVAAFRGTRIGVMWSNQVAEAVYFAVHTDGAARDVWTVRSAALSPKIAAASASPTSFAPSTRPASASPTWSSTRRASTTSPAVLLPTRRSSYSPVTRRRVAGPATSSVGSATATPVPS